MSKHNMHNSIDTPLTATVVFLHSKKYHAFHTPTLIILKNWNIQLNSRPDRNFWIMRHSRPIHHGVVASSLEIRHWRFNVAVLSLIPSPSRKRKKRKI